MKQKYNNQLRKRGGKNLRNRCTSKSQQPQMNKYQVLGASKSASLQELRGKYQAKARETHPDKQGRHTNESQKAEAAKQFLAVQEAWETLRDADLRQEYDSRLSLQEAHVVVSDEVNADEMEYDQTDEGSYSHECRCGEAYVVSSAELREGFDVVGCLGCSLYIRVVGPSSGITESAPENDP